MNFDIFIFECKNTHADPHTKILMLDIEINASPNTNSNVDINRILVLIAAPPPPPPLGPTLYFQWNICFPEESASNSSNVNVAIAART